MKRKAPVIAALVVLVALALYFTIVRRSPTLTLTGIVTTDEIIVSPEIQGRVQQLLVNQGDAVRSNQLLAVLQPQEWQADVAFYANSAGQSVALVAQAEADVNFQQALTSNQIWQAEANLAAAEAQVVQAEADLEIARLNFEREQGLYKEGAEPVQNFDQMRTAYDAGKAKTEAVRKQAQAAQAAVGLARANAEQVAARRAALQAATNQLAAATAQKEKAKVRLGYTAIRAPADGVVDVRAALQGETVNPGQAIVTLVNPDNLWVRVDVEETYIDRVRLGDSFDVRLPSGAIRRGTVFFRGIDADYATQRDVSRTKRDIKTFAIKVSLPNDGRRLFTGMTATVLLPPPLKKGWFSRL